MPLKVNNTPIYPTNKPTSIELYYGILCTLQETRQKEIQRAGGTNSGRKEPSYGLQRRIIAGHLALPMLPRASSAASLRRRMCLTHFFSGIFGTWDSWGHNCMSNSQGWKGE